MQSKKWKLLVLACFVIGVWVGVGKNYLDLRGIGVYAGGPGSSCADGCYCTDFFGPELDCKGPSVCNSMVGDYYQSHGWNYYTGCDSSPNGYGNYGHQYYCPGTCSGSDGGGTCGSFTAPACGGGTCPNGRNCVSVGNNGLCGCAAPPASGGGYVDYTCNPPTINGWAVWEGHNNELWINAINTPGGDYYYKHQQTNLLRSDVNTLYGISGNHGFSLDFPPEWVDGVSRTVKIGATPNSNVDEVPFGTELPGSPLTIICVPPPANTAPTGTLDCPTSPITLGQSASFSLHGSDSEGNLSRAELWRSPAIPSNPGGDWSAINANVACTGSPCNPPAISWTPPEAKTYKIAANYFDSGTPAKQCSGNPFLTFPIGDWVACATPNTNDSCTLQVKVDGVCSANHYACTAGTNPSGNTTGGTNVDGATAWTWVCNGINGGSPAYCSQAKPIISGHVYNDPNNTCVISTSTGFDGRTVTLDGVTKTTDANGAFSFVALGGLQSLAVSLPAGYVCSPWCANALGEGCSGRDVTTPPDSLNNNFFLTQSREAWWQIDGAGAYAGATSGTVVKSELPLISTKLITKITGNAGALFRSDGNVDLGAGSVSDDLWSTKSTYKGTKMDYAYFAKKLGVLAGQANNWLTNDLSTSPSSMGDGFLYQAGPSVVNSAMSIPNGISIIVFVNGDLRINADVTVNPGAFLAVIAKGNITVDPGVTQVQGLYVTSGSFVSEPSGGVDTQLEVEGSVVGWNGVTLSRDLGVGNISDPAEKFTFRPDLLMNMPDSMKSFAMEWQEVVPGSF